MRTNTRQTYLDNPVYKALDDSVIRMHNIIFELQRLSSSENYRINDLRMAITLIEKSLSEALESKRKCKNCKVKLVKNSYLPSYCSPECFTMYNEGLNGIYSQMVKV